MISENIINQILENNLSEAKAETEILLYQKMGEHLAELRTYISSTTYGSRFLDLSEGDKDGPEYEKFFRAALKKFGVSDPEELEGEQKKEFFDYIDSNWESDTEDATGKEDPTSDDEDAVASEKEANKKKMVRDNKDEDDDLDEASAARKAETRYLGRYEYGTGRKKKKDYQRETDEDWREIARVGDDAYTDEPGSGRRPIAQVFKRDHRRSS